MLLILFAFLVLTAYTGVGMVTERKRYALSAYNYSQIGENEDFYQRKYAEAKRKRSAIQHKTHCFLNYDILADKGCFNCSPDTTKEYDFYSSEMKAAKANAKQFPKPSINPGVIFGWPLYGANVWLKSGTVEASKTELSNEQRISMLEADIAKRELELGIGGDQ